MGQIVSDVTTILDYNKSKKEAKTQRQKILAQIAEDEKNKTNLVKKALAAQRAKYGADGMSSKGITEGAVLKRLKSETEQPFDEKKRLNMERYRSIKPDNHNLLKSILKRLGKQFDLWVREKEKNKQQQPVEDIS
ncbi:MAG: hypothetical protein LBJ73_02685 [Rickettsiales bacterium]|jgi:hypothetical protein|nr:hypothetical protein [Rickettsiales bacterium]